MVIYRQLKGECLQRWWDNSAGDDGRTALPCFNVTVGQFKC